MTTNGGADILPLLDLPPGHPNTAYTLPSLGGEIIYIPLSKSATRLLVTGKETSNAFAIVGSGGTHSDPIGFHYHREAHDIFLCLKGNCNIWVGDQCRTLSPGDFASAPPGAIHQYQILGSYSEFIGLIVPGGWEEFFRFIGEPYLNGPMFPVEDERNLFEVLIPKLKAAAEKFDMVPQPHIKPFPPQSWEEGKDNVLPGKREPYFLKNGTGPKYLVGGMLVRPLATMRESQGRFEIASIEGSNWHKSGIFEGKNQGFVFEQTHHCLQVADGYVEFTVKGAKARLGQGETIYVPAGTDFKLEFASKYAKVYVFSSGDGLVELLLRLGKPHEHHVVPEKEADFDRSQLEGLQQELKYSLR